MRTDGSVIIDTKILDDGMEKGFERIKSDVGSVADEAQKAAQNIKSAFSEMDVSRPVADAMRKVADLERQLESVMAEHKISIAEGDDEGGERLARKMTSIYDRLEAARERLAREVAKAASKQAKAEEKAAERAKKAAEKEAKAKEKAMNKAYKSATKGARRFGSRLTEILSGALIFNAISRGLRSVTSYFGEALKTNDQYRESLASLKGALLTAFQPIYEFVAPAITYLIRLLTMAVQAIGRFFTFLSGKSYSQMQKNAEALNKEAEALGAVGGAAEEAARQLAGFDEINRLESSSQSGGGGGGSEGVSPNFSEIENDGMKEKLSDILRIVGAVSAALLTWKIASSFMKSLTAAAGLALSIGGAFLFATNWADAFANGIDWGNLSGMLLGMVAIAGGLFLAFGNVAAGVALVVSGVMLSIVALKDWIKTGELSHESCLALVAGILAIGAAISLFTGSWIPLVIAGIASAALALWNYWDEVQAWAQRIDAKLTQVARNIYDFFASVINGALELWYGFWNLIGGIGTGGKGMRTPDYAANYSSSAYSVVTEIPMLAKGAVIPPNAPFMAVLGDQRNGTNIEAPADLIRQIFREELADTGGSMTAELLRELISVVENISVGDETIGRAAARYNRRASRAGGY